jgi:hypothetical protein
MEVKAKADLVRPAAVFCVTALLKGATVSRRKASSARGVVLIVRSREFPLPLEADDLIKIALGVRDTLEITIGARSPTLSS